jgi:hypothetical protein
LQKLLINAKTHVNRSIQGMPRSMKRNQNAVRRIFYYHGIARIVARIAKKVDVKIYDIFLKNQTVSFHV